VTQQYLERKKGIGGVGREPPKKRKIKVRRKIAWQGRRKKGSPTKGGNGAAEKGKTSKMARCKAKNFKGQTNREGEGEGGRAEKETHREKEAKACQNRPS